MINQTIGHAGISRRADLSRRNSRLSSLTMPLPMLFVGNLTLFIAEQKSKVRRKSSSRSFRWCNQTRKSDQNSPKVLPISNLSQASTAATARAEKDSNHAMRTGANCPTRFSQSHKLTIPLHKPNRSNSKF